MTYSREYEAARRAMLIRLGRIKPGQDYVDSAPVLAHLAALYAAGLRGPAIAATAGVGYDTLWDIRHRGPSRPVRSATARKILSVPVPSQHCSERATLQIRALFALGYSATRTAEALGVRPGAIREWAAGRAAPKSPALRAALDAHMRVIGDTPGPDKSATRRAGQAGWLTPAWYDDDWTLSPEVLPDVKRAGAGRPPTAHPDDIAELRELGLSDDGIAARLGVKPSTLYAREWRANRQLDTAV